MIVVGNLGPHYEITSIGNGINESHKKLIFLLIALKDNWSFNTNTVIMHFTFVTYANVTFNGTKDGRQDLEKYCNKFFRLHMKWHIII